MLQYATYSVISPEGCASILWRSAEMAPDAADALGITASRLKTLGLIDKIVPEPLGNELVDEAESLQPARSEEHTSELQSRLHLVCRLLLEKKKNKRTSSAKLFRNNYSHC